MEYKKTEIAGVFIIEPRVFSDARGYFMESWKEAELHQKNHFCEILRLFLFVFLRKMY